VAFHLKRGKLWPTAHKRYDPRRPGWFMLLGKVEACYERMRTEGSNKARKRVGFTFTENLIFRDGSDAAARL